MSHPSSLSAEVRGHGAPLVLLHGFPLDHSMWQHQITAFSGSFQVIAPDLPGFGQSPLAAGTEIVTMEDMADSVHSLLEHLRVKTPIVLCGLSMGGYVAFEFWRKYAARVRALVLCDTKAEPDTPEAAEVRRSTAASVLADGPEAIAETMIGKIFGATTRKQSTPAVASMRNVMLSTEPEAIAAALRGMAERRDSTPLLESITVPTLAVVGEEDTLTPPEVARNMATAIPGAALVTIPAAGHMAPLEQPHAVNDVLRTFLSKLPPID